MYTPWWRETAEQSFWSPEVSIPHLPLSACHRQIGHTWVCLTLLLLVWWYIFVMLIRDIVEHFLLIFQLLTILYHGMNTALDLLLTSGQCFYVE